MDGPTRHRAARVPDGGAARAERTRGPRRARARGGAARPRLLMTGSGLPAPGFGSQLNPGLAAPVQAPAREPVHSARHVVPGVAPVDEVDGVHTRVEERAVVVGDGVA